MTTFHISFPALLLAGFLTSSPVLAQQHGQGATSPAPGTAPGQGDQAQATPPAATPQTAPATPDADGGCPCCKKMMKTAMHMPMQQGMAGGPAMPGMEMQPGAPTTNR